MTKIEEYAEVRTESGIYRDWTSVVVEQAVGSSVERRFVLECAEPTLKSFVLKPKDRVDLALAGKQVVIQGFVTDRDVYLGPRGHMVRVTGTSKAGPISNVSVDLPGGGQFRGYGIEAICNKVLAPHGLTFRVENGPKGFDTPFPNMSVRYGESPFSVITRLCRQRNMWWRTEPDGSVVAGKVDGGNKVAFVEGQNILELRCGTSISWIEHIRASGQQPGSDSLFGKAAAEVQASATVTNGVKGNQRKIAAEMPISAREAQLRTDMEVSMLQEAILQATLTYQGWLRPGDGELWRLSDLVTVKSPTAFPTEAGEVDLRVWGITYAQDAQAGTTTTLQLRNMKAFGEGLQDAKRAERFFQQQQEGRDAQPDTPT